MKLKGRRKSCVDTPTSGHFFIQDLFWQQIPTFRKQIHLWGTLVFERTRHEGCRKQSKRCSNEAELFVELFETLAPS